MQMKLCLFFLFILEILFGPGLLFAQPGKVSISTEPGWVTKNNYDFSKTSLDKEAIDGYIDIAIDKQVYLSDQTEYIKRSIRIISQAGVQNGSQVSVSFDPAYQQLSFHSIHIIRKGAILERLRLADIKTVHQEKELNNFIYNGALDAVLIVDDVRQGDILEYSYSRKGFNPIFKNKFTTTFNLQFSFPVYELYFKLIVPAGRKINIKNLNETLQPVFSTYNGQQVYVWQKTNSRALTLQDDTPSWFDPYAQVLISEYNNWKEVNEWALELFPAKKILSADVQQKIAEIKEQCKSDEERTQAALMFVQDDIRYMGIEMGQNSHKPADPSKIFSQRFGDCKEKSYLLCCMLRAMNIEASPVLINTTVKKSILEWLPAPTDFDHVTVRAKLNDVYYWFDPTIAYQRGDIKNLYFPDYQAGLVVSEDIDALTTITHRNVSSVKVKEYFKVASMAGGGTLFVTTIYQGDPAGNVRNDFNEQSIKELMTTYQKFYARYYENIKADSLDFEDDDRTGNFTVREYYSIPDFWTVDKGSINRFSFSAFVIDAILSRPKERDRTMPFSLSFPAKYNEEVIVELPKDWAVTDNDVHLKNSCFVFNSKLFCTNNKVHLQTNYESYKDHSTIDDSRAYFKDLAKYDLESSVELSSGKDDVAVKSSSNSSSGKNILTGLLVAALIIGVVVYTQKK
ncbi:MAG: DUF3857 domain-containing transglutaminase family protein [Ferruginibacter sp.]